MNRHGIKNTNRRLLAAGLITASLGAAAIGVFSPAGAGAAPAEAKLHGVFRETAAGSALGYDIAGSAKLTVKAGTVATVNVAGLDPAKHYGSHLHNGTCASGGGGHYQDVPGPLVTPPNELWLTSSANPLGTLDPNPGGVAHATGTALWAARTNSVTATNARSVVVHEPVTGTRIACADLG